MDAQSRYVRCCQQGDSQGAIELLKDLPSYVDPILQGNGRNALHIACLYSMPEVIRQIIQLQQHGVEVLGSVDQKGNSVLHYACMSSKQCVLETVRYLVSDLQVSIAARNALGQTPYDVSTSDAVRQFLLPLQLQQETRQALENGGKGLMPGMDLGGLKITNSNLPPPPTATSMAPAGVPTQRYPQYGWAQPGAQSSASMTATSPAVMSVLQPPPPLLSMTPPAMPGNQFSEATATLNSSSSVPSGEQQQSPTMFGVTKEDAGSKAPYPDIKQFTKPPSSSSLKSTSTNSISTPKAYSRTGSSSAVIEVKGKQLRKPDGFHSSSSCKELQEKYGHSQVGLMGTLPPPPKSGPSPGTRWPAPPRPPNFVSPVSSVQSELPQTGTNFPLATGRSEQSSASHPIYTECMAAPPTPSFSQQSPSVPGSAEMKPTSVETATAVESSEQSKNDPVLISSPESMDFQSSNAAEIFVDVALSPVEAPPLPTE